jgi:predicted RecB family nuclease
MRGMFVNENGITNFEQMLQESTGHPLTSSVRIYKGTVLLPIWWFDTLVFCEKRLEHLTSGIDISPTLDELEGRFQHERLEEEFAKHATVVDIDTLYTKLKQPTKRRPEETRECRLFSKKHHIYGRIDRILHQGTTTIIIDNKPNTIPYPSRIAQVAAYCLAYIDVMKNSDKIKMALANRETDVIGWTEPFTFEHAKVVKHLTRRYMNFLDDTSSVELDFRASHAKCQCCKYTMCDSRW